MTIPFFHFDVDLTCTVELRNRLHRGMDNYEETGRELVVGAGTDEHLPCEACLFFLSDYSLVDPAVHCLTSDNQFLATKSLSKVVTGLRGFPDCKNVPQGLFDYYWYLGKFQVPLEHNPVDISMKITDWKLDGRVGMEDRFKGHPVEWNDVDSDKDSVFSPFYYL